MEPHDYCHDAWKALHAEKVLPLARDAVGNLVPPPYVPRVGGLGRPVPNICLKLPTGGGKTLLGCAGVERINPEYFGTQTGLEWRPFDYERDLLSRVDWAALHYAAEGFAPDEHESVERTLTRVSVEDLGREDAAALPAVETTEQDVPPELDIPAMVRLLLDVVPNPWQGVRILNETLAVLRGRGISEQRLYTNRLFLLKAMREELRAQVHRATEAEFRRMLHDGELCFQLEASGDPKLNWELAESFEFDVTEDDRELRRENGQPLERSLLEKVYRSQFNTLERPVAWYLDADAAVGWWHRIAVHHDYHVQGWQRGRVYPDFLVCLRESGDGLVRLTVLETKGLHLRGNEDTEYKRRLFELLTECSQTAVPVGELKLSMQQQVMRFELLLEDNWKSRLVESLRG